MCVHVIACACVVESCGQKVSGRFQQVVGGYMVASPPVSRHLEEEKKKRRKFVLLSFCSVQFKLHHIHLVSARGFVSVAQDPGETPTFVCGSETSRDLFSFFFFFTFFLPWCPHCSSWGSPSLWADVVAMAPLRKKRWLAEREERSSDGSPGGRLTPVAIWETTCVEARWRIWWDL